MNPNAASRKGIVASSGMPTIDTISATINTTSAGTKSTSTARPVRIDAPGERPEIDAIHPGATRVRISATAIVRDSLNTDPQKANPVHDPLPVQSGPIEMLAHGNLFSSIEPRTDAPGSSVTLPPTETAFPSTTAFGPRWRLPPTTTTSSTARPSI